MICNKIIHNLININDLNFIKFRDILYDIFIYNLDITDCIWYIITSLVKEKKIHTEQLPNILIKTYGIPNWIFTNNIITSFNII